MNTSIIRSSVYSDLPAIKGIIDSVELFPSELLDDMFSDSEEDSDSAAFWLTYDHDSPIAIAYCAPEAMTRGTWNLLLIAVHLEHQSQGIGTKMMSHIEERLTSAGARVLLVETSGSADFEKTRVFYSQLGYHEEARIREYYDVGDDKVVFRKTL